ncbi:hypothetical protein BU17DRAFT_69648 [Hysterangium stoloniferum]|nr:hypothetical protein BU17DRAFT_69648 [Hysterangium stoloniferum]
MLKPRAEPPRHGGIITFSFLRSMDSTSAARDEQPPKKKRRVVAPLFESAFDTIDSPYKPRRSAESRKSFTDAFQDFASTFDRSTKTASTSKLTDSTVGTIPSSVQGLEDSSDFVKSKEKRLSDTLLDFAAVFDLPTPSFKPKARLTKPVSKLHTERPNVSFECKVDEAFFGGASTVPQSNGTSTVPCTPLRLIKPPLFREGLGTETTSSMKTIPSHPSKYQETVSTPDAKGKGRAMVTSMASHLLHLQDSASSHTPKTTSGQEKKLVSLAPPVFQADSSALINSGSPAIGNSAVSVTQRAAILTHSVIEQFKNETANIELSKFARGLYVSPQKMNKEYGQKFLRGGLAERAQHLLSRAHTSFTLWQAGIQKQLEGSYQPKEDLRLRILSVLGYTRQLGKHASLPRNAVTRCREIPGDISEEETQPQEGTVVFLFAMHEKK